MIRITMVLITTLSLTMAMRIPRQARPKVVYRTLRTYDPVNGRDPLVPTGEPGTTNAFDHVAWGSTAGWTSQFISTTASLEQARKWVRDELEKPSAIRRYQTARIAKIDLSRPIRDVNVVYLTDPNVRDNVFPARSAIPNDAERTNFAHNNAISHQEVLLEVTRAGAGVPFTLVDPRTGQDIRPAGQSDCPTVRPATGKGKGLTGKGKGRGVPAVVPGRGKGQELPLFGAGAFPELPTTVKPALATLVEATAASPTVDTEADTFTLAAEEDRRTPSSSSSDTPTEAPATSKGRGKKGRGKNASQVLLQSLFK